MQVESGFWAKSRTLTIQGAAYPQRKLLMDVSIVNMLMTYGSLVGNLRMIGMVCYHVE